jgi:hypothetical protein
LFKNFLPVAVCAVLLEKNKMKKITWLLVIACFAAPATAQEDTALTNRLLKVLEHTRAMDMEKVLDYTYPKLFTIVPREQMLEALKSSYDTEEFVIGLDSVEIDTIFPAFIIEGASYALIRHTMLMRMKYKEPLDTADTEDQELLALGMEQQFGEGNVRFDKEKNSLNIFMLSDMVAIKDSFAKEWCFVNFEEDNPTMLKMLFSDKVLDKLKTFKKP